MPPLTAEEFRALREDIRRNGVLVPVEVDEHGEILDGHHRVAVCRDLGITTYPRIVRAGLATDAEKRRHALTLNLTRRHLSRQQRREVLRALRADGASIRSLATLTGLSRSTIHRDVSGVPHGTPEARVKGLDGKQYPSRRPTSIFAATASQQDRALRALAALGDSAPSRTLDLRRAERLARDTRAHDQRQRETEDASPLSVRVLHADFRALPVEPGSVDAIITDPPYTKTGMALWPDLARQAATWLKPGGFFAAYTGQMFLPQAMRALGDRLDYWWVIALTHTSGHVAQVRQRHLGSRWRPILLYRNGGEGTPPWFIDHLVGGGRERDLHPWQQAVAESEELIRLLTQPGDLVVDPFMGSGTTAVAAQRTGRQCLGGDIDPEAVRLIEQRLRTGDPGAPGHTLHCCRPQRPG